MVSKGLGFQGERGGGGGQLSLIEFFTGSRTMFFDCQSGGRSLVEASVKFYYDEPKSSVLTPPPPPHTSSQAMIDDQAKSWCVVLSLYRTHCIKITCTQT